MGRRLEPVRPRAPLQERSGGESWIAVIDRGGLEVRVTDLERTVADVLDRLSLAGGVVEVWRSLSSVPAVDPDALVDYVETIGNRTLAARVGFFLETRREELAVPRPVLERLRGLLPKQPVHFDRALGGRLVPGWRLIVPREVADVSDGGGA
jgi:predicted transcriptional regulator of viral defense system